MDNTTTYQGFSPKRKSALLYSGVDEQIETSTDVAIISGMRFSKPIAPRQMRRLLHFIALDTNEARLRATVEGIISPRLAAGDDALTTLWPNPASMQIQVHLDPLTSDRTIAIFDAQGRRVIDATADDISNPVSTVTIDVSHLANGTYYLRQMSSSGVRSTPFVVLR